MNLQYNIHTLPNGIRIAHMPLISDVSYCGFITNTGTRDELPCEYGMAHFVEHMLFKGTRKRRSHHIINRMETVGGELNAYTNKEETVIYSVCLEEHFERAFELLTDMTFHSIFPQHEIEKEIDVIVDEINSYEDNPSELIYDEFEDMVFSGSQLGHNILGEPQLLKTFDTEKVQFFIERNYVPSETVFFSLGKTDFRKIIKLAERYLSPINAKKHHDKREIPPSVDNSIETVSKNTAQAHVIMGCSSYGLHDPRRRSLHLLNNILGGPGMNSRLNISLREKRGLVYNVESNLTNYSDTGLFSIYFGTEKDNVSKCIKLINNELNKLKENKLSARQLSSAKKQLIGQISIASDNHENLALSFGKSILRYNHFDSMKETISKIEAISEINLLEIANEVFTKSNLHQLIYR